MGHIKLTTEIPGPKSREVLARHDRFVARALALGFPAAISEARGALLTDVDGNQFIDLAGGVGVLNVGHSDPEVVGAARDQLERFVHTDYTVAPYAIYAELARRLAGLVPGAEKAAFFNAGAEAVENSSKMARAYTAAREIFDMRTLWAEIEVLDNRVQAGTQMRIFLEGRKLVERATRWLLRNRRAPLDIAATISYFSEGAAELTELIPGLMLDGDREAMERATEQMVEANVPPELAKRSAILGAMFSALDIVDVASATGQPLEAVAAVYFTLGDRLSTGCATTSRRSPGTTAGEHSRGRRCATTSTASRPRLPPRSCAPYPRSFPPSNVSTPGWTPTRGRWTAPCKSYQTSTPAGPSTSRRSR